MSHKFSGKLLLWLLLVGLVGLFRPEPTFAHVALLASVPAAGANLESSPNEIKLTFGGPLQPQSNFVLATDDFEFIAGVESRLVPVPGNQLVAQLPALAAGNYTIYWDVVGEDGDRVTGSFSFVVLSTGGKLLRQPVVRGGILLLVIGLVYWRLRPKKKRR